MKLEGTITSPAGTVPAAYASVTDLQTRKRFYSGRPDAQGNFVVYLKDKSTYELSVDPEQGNTTYFSKRYNLVQNANLNTQRVTASLKVLEAGDEVALDALQFKPYTSELDDPTSELRRLSRLLKSTPEYDFELQVLLAGYVEDSVASSPDLTEIIKDSVLMQVEDIDTLGQLYTYDSLIIETTYHNNRTQKQAENLLAELVALGVDTSRVITFTNARPEAVLENRKNQVRLRVLPRKQR
jgi:hypothetical protein